MARNLRYVFIAAAGGVVDSLSVVDVAATSTVKASSGKEVHDAFKAFDADASGGFNIAELKAYLRSISIGSPAEAMKLMRIADKNGDWVLNFEEFDACVFRPGACVGGDTTLVTHRNTWAETASAPANPKPTSGPARTAAPAPVKNTTLVSLSPKDPVNVKQHDASNSSGTANKIAPLKDKFSGLMSKVSQGSTKLFQRLFRQNHSSDTGDAAKATVAKATAAKATAAKATAAKVSAPSQKKTMYCNEADRKVLSPLGMVPNASIQITAGCKPLLVTMTEYNAEAHVTCLQDTLKVSTPCAECQVDFWRRTIKSCARVCMASLTSTACKACSQPELYEDCLRGSKRKPPRPHKVSAKIMTNATGQNDTIALASRNRKRRENTEVKAAAASRAAKHAPASRTPSSQTVDQISLASSAPSAAASTNRTRIGKITDGLRLFGSTISTKIRNIGHKS